MALSCLLPVLDNELAFFQNYLKLFGEQALSALQEIKKLLHQYDGSKEFITHSRQMEVLVDVNFRERIVQFMQQHSQHFQDFYDETETFAQRLQRIRLPKVWGGEHEIKAMSLFFERKIEVRQKDSEKIITYGAAYPEIIYLVYSSASQDMSAPNNHYHFLIASRYINNLKNVNSLQNVPTAPLDPTNKNVAVLDDNAVQQQSTTLAPSAQRILQTAVVGTGVKLEHSSRLIGPEITNVDIELPENLNEVDKQTIDAAIKEWLKPIRSTQSYGVSAAPTTINILPSKTDSHQNIIIQSSLVQNPQGSVNLQNSKNTAVKIKVYLMPNVPNTTTRLSAKVIRDRLNIHYSLDYKEIPRSLAKLPQFANLESLSMAENHFISLNIVDRQTHIDATNSALSNSVHELEFDLDKYYQVYEDIYQAPKAGSTSVSVLFGDVKPTAPKKVLLLGQPGIGKTTLCQYICYQWAQGKLWQKQFNIIFKVNLRNLKKSIYINKSLKLPTVIADECFDQRSVAPAEDKIDHFLMEYPHNQILLILDGYDECPDEHQSLVNQILKDDYNVLVTSRPRTNVSAHAFNLVVECVGFDNYHIDRFISQHEICRDRILQNELIDFFESHPTFYNLMHVPLLLDIFCSIWVGEKSESFLFSVTGLYRLVTSQIWGAYERRSNGTLPSPNATLDPAKVKKIEEFYQLLAYHTIEDKDFLIKKEVINDTVQKVYCCLDFQVDRYIDELLFPGMLCTTDNENFYYLHRSFQEYYAAAHWVKLFSDPTTTKDAIAYFKSNKFNPAFWQMWYFVSGICSQQLGDSIKFLKLLFEEPHAIIGHLEALLYLRCIDEALDTARNKSLLKDLPLPPLLNDLINWINMDAKNQQSKLPDEKGIFEYVLKSSPHFLACYVPEYPYVGYLSSASIIKWLAELDGTDSRNNWSTMRVLALLKCPTDKQDLAKVCARFSSIIRSNASSEIKLYAAYGLLRYKANLSGMEDIVRICITEFLITISDDSYFFQDALEAMLIFIQKYPDHREKVFTELTSKMNGEAITMISRFIVLFFTTSSINMKLFIERHIGLFDELLRNLFYLDIFEEEIIDEAIVDLYNYLAENDDQTLMSFLTTQFLTGRNICNALLLLTKHKLYPTQLLEAVKLMVADKAIPSKERIIALSWLYAATDDGNIIYRILEDGAEAIEIQLSALILFTQLTEKNIFYFLKFLNDQDSRGIVTTALRQLKNNVQCKNIISSKLEPVLEKIGVGFEALDLLNLTIFCVEVMPDHKTIPRMIESLLSVRRHFFFDDYLNSDTLISLFAKIKPVNVEFDSHINNSVRKFFQWSTQHYEFNCEALAIILVNRGMKDVVFDYINSGIAYEKLTYGRINYFDNGTTITHVILALYREFPQLRTKLLALILGTFNTFKSDFAKLHMAQLLVTIEPEQAFACYLRNNNLYCLSELLRSAVLSGQPVYITQNKLYIGTKDYSLETISNFKVQQDAQTIVNNKMPQPSEYQTRNLLDSYKTRFLDRYRTRFGASHSMTPASTFKPN